MKTSAIVKNALTGLLVLTLSGAFAQDCFKSIKRFCRDLPYEDYDYIGQSSYANLLPGDTAQFDVIFYSAKDYRIMLCADPILGEIEFEVYHQVKERIRVIVKIDRIEHEPQPIYELDEWGSPKTDPYTYEPIQKKDAKGNPLFDRQPPSIDTTFETRTETKLIKLFDNKSQATNVYDEIEVSKTRRLQVKVYVPPGSSASADRHRAQPGGCVNLLVGNKYSRRKDFRKYR